MIWAAIIILAGFLVLSVLAERRTHRIVSLKLALDALCLVLLGFSQDAIHAHSRIHIFVVYFVGNLIVLQSLLGEAARTRPRGDSK